MVREKREVKENAMEGSIAKKSHFWLGVGELQEFWGAGVGTETAL